MIDELLVYLAERLIIGNFAEEGFDFQVLLDPLKEQLYLPALFVNFGDSFGGPVELIGGKDIMFASQRVAIADASHRA